MNNQNAAQDSVEKLISVRKPLKLISIALIIALVFIATTLVATGVLSVESLHRLANSPVWLIFRLCWYALFWFGWKTFMTTMGITHDESLIRKSRRPLLVLFIVYECFFANNIVQLLR